MPISLDVAWAPAFLLVVGLLLLLGGGLLPWLTGRFLAVGAVLLPPAVLAAPLGLLFLAYGGLIPGSHLLISNDLMGISGIIRDPLSLSWLFTSASAAAVLFLWRNASFPAPTREQRTESFAGLLLLAMTQIAALTGHIWVQWVAIVFSGWMLAVLLGRDSSERNRTEGAAACLIWLSVADLLWLLGLTRMASVFGSAEIISLGNPNLLQRLSAGEVAIVVTGLMWLLISLVLRCGLYPLMNWTGRGAQSLRNAAWLGCFGMGSGLLLLLRWLPLLAYFPQIRLLMAGIGGLSAALLAVIGWSKISTAERIVPLLGAELGLVWLGGAAAPDKGELLVRLGLGFLTLFPILSLGVEQLSLASSSKRFWSMALYGIAGIACSGILGQEWVLDAAWQTSLLPAVNSRVLAMGALLGMAVMAFCLFQLASASRIAPLEANDISMRKPASRPATAIVLLLTVFGFAGLLEAELVCSGRWNPPGVPAVNLIIMLIGAIAAWTWPMRATLKGGSKFLLWRLAEEEFYVPSIIEVAVLMPLRGLAQLSRFFEWIVIVQLVRGIPSRVLAETGEVAALADEDTNDSKAAAQTLLAVIVMIVGLVLLGR